MNRLGKRGLWAIVFSTVSGFVILWLLANGSKVASVAEAREECESLGDAGCAAFVARKARWPLSAARCEQDDQKVTISVHLFGRGEGISIRTDGSICTFGYRE